MRRFISKNIFYPIFLIRDGNNYTKYNKVIRKEIDRKNFSENEQYNLLKGIITFAYKYSPFYKQFYIKHDFHPSDFKVIDDLKNIPIIEKTHIRDYLKEILVPNFKNDQLVPSATGGTTGNSFTFYYDRECYLKRNALTNFANIQYDWHIGDTAAVIWSAHQDIGGHEGLKVKIRRLLAEPTYILDASSINEKIMEKWKELIMSKKIKVVYGYPNSIHIFAKYLSDSCVKNLPVKVIVTTAEPLYVNNRKIIEKAFGCPVFDRYASREHGPMAQECKEGNMHYFSHSIYIETLKNESEPLEAAEVLVTDFWNHAVPFIRYRIGDKTTLLKTKCDCGSTLPQRGTIAGRNTDFLIASDGSLVSGMSLHEVFLDKDGKNPGKGGYEQIQFIQTERNKVLVKIVKGPDFFVNKDEPFIKKIIKSFVGHSANVEFSYVQSIPKTRSGKYRFTINAIDNPTESCGLPDTKSM